MNTGYCGTFVISWSQTEVDGLEAAPLNALTIGAAWSWKGQPVRVDGPTDVLRLERTKDGAELRRRAARTVRRLVGAVVQDQAVRTAAELESIDVADPQAERGFILTNGAQTYAVTVIEVGQGQPPLLLFLDAMPPRDAELWVVAETLGPRRGNAVREDGAGVICFTPGTRISTPQGPCLVEDLSEGDLVLTRDSGPQPVLWTGAKRMTGARLMVMPHLRPIRLSAGALGLDRPDADLWVSPQHRMLLRGARARALFNTDEVLVPARDLVDDDRITVDRRLREVTYVHLLLPRHEIIWANGLETESFHPAGAALGSLNARDLDRLVALLPEVSIDPHAYGGFARRLLNGSETAILRHAAA